MKISVDRGIVTSRWEFGFMVACEDVFECLMSILNRELAERLGWKFCSCFEFEGKITCVTNSLVSYRKMERVLRGIIEEYVPFVQGEVECDAQQLSQVMWNFLMGE